MRSCQKSAGPGEARRMANAMATMNGAVTTPTTSAPPMSSMRFMTLNAASPVTQLPR